MLETEIVKSFVDGCLESDIAKLKTIRDETTPASPLYQTFRAIVSGYSANRDERLLLEACQQFRDALAQPPQDAELFAVLLRQAGLSFLEMNRLGDTARCCRILKQLDSQLLRPEVRAQVLHAESTLNYGLGDYAQAQALLTQALSLDIPRGSKTWYRLKAVRADRARLNYDFVTAEQDLADLEAKNERGQRPLSFPFAYLKANLAYTRGKLEEALAILGSLPEDLKSAGRNHLCLYLELLLRTKRVSEAGQILAGMDKQPEKLPRRLVEGLRSLLAIVQKDLPAARAHIQLAIACSTGADPVFLRSEFSYFLQIELASKNLKGASLILDLLDRPQADPNLISCWTRFHLLSGDEERAAHGFRILLEKGGPELVAARFAFAYEVSAQQLARLWVLASGTPAVAKAPAAQGQALGRRLEPQAVLVCHAPVMRAVTEQIRKFATRATPVLIVGETGVGKEVVARLLHERSSRAAHPFLTVRCETLSETLLEAELLGYEKDAFPGAAARQDGVFVAAGQGTVLLDDVDALSPRGQAAVLRVLETQQAAPLGARCSREVQARILATTRLLPEECANGAVLRPEFYFRLSQLRIQIPPLRERPEDIPSLAEHFLRDLDRAGAVTLGQDLLRALQKYAWPGNVRELKNELERIVLLASGRGVLGADLFRLSQGGFIQPLEKAPVSVRHAVAYFLEHLSRPLSLEETARAAQVSPFHLTVLFKDAGLKSPMACLREMRLVQAQALLSRRELRIKEVAAAVGYASMSTFWRAYVRHFKHPPSQESKASARLASRTKGPRTPPGVRNRAPGGLQAAGRTSPGVGAIQENGPP